MYIKNEDLYKQIVEWKAALAVNPETRMPEVIGKAIMDTANGFTNYFRFSRYTDDWKEAMVGDAVETCVRKLHLFDTDRYTNPHAYITMICARCFFNRIKYEKKKAATKYKYFIEHVFDFEDEDMVKSVDIDFYNDMVSKVHEFDEQSKKAPVEKVQPVGISWMEEDWDVEVDDIDEEIAS